MELVRDREAAMTMQPSNRRGFLATCARAGGWILGGLALVGLPGCDQGPAAGGADLDPDDDFGMHGPVEISIDSMALPAAAGARALFAPYADGAPFLRRWAVDHVGRGRWGELVVVMRDTETGGHAEVELYALEATVDPVAFTDRYAVIVDNGGHGDALTPLHLRRLAARLAEIVASNEHTVELAWALPTLPEASRAREDAERALFDEAP